MYYYYTSFFLFDQIQGTREHFRDTCGGVIGWLDSKTYYTAFLEGWALYAENPLVAKDTDVYDGQPMKKYGMLKWQVSAITGIDAIKLFCKLSIESFISQ